jgi:hypothetical protein
VVYLRIDTATGKTWIKYQSSDTWKEVKEEEINEENLYSLSLYKQRSARYNTAFCKYTGSLGIFFNV